jgi:protein TonB
VVEKDGKLTDIQVKNDPSYGLEDEAIRVLKSLKQKFQEKINSKPVRTSYKPIILQMN